MSPEPAADPRACSSHGAGPAPGASCRAAGPCYYSNEPELIRPVETQPVLAQAWHQHRVFTQLLHWSWLVSGRLGEWEE